MFPEYDLHFLVTPGVSMTIRVRVEAKHYDVEEAINRAAEHLQQKLGVFFTHHDLVD